MFFLNLKLYFDFIPITTAEFSEEKVIHTLILELNENDRLETFRIFKDSVSVENLEGSYAIVFYAEVDNIISYIDTQYYINYSDSEELPSELISAVKELVIIKCNTLGTEGLNSQSSNGVSENYSNDIPKPIKKKLNRYRKVGWQYEYCQ